MNPLRIVTARYLAACALLAGAARADLTPEWITDLPLGPAFASGIQDVTVSAAGITYVTGITGASSNSDVITAAIGPDGTVLWTQTWDGPVSWHDQGRGIALGPNGVVWVCGNTPDPMFYANVLLLEFDAATGALLNTVVYSSGPGTSEHGESIVVDPQGNVYVGGGTVGDGADALFLKFDSAGVLQWSQVWDGPAFAPYSQDTVLKMMLSPQQEPVALVHGVGASNHPDYVVLKLATSSGATTWEAVWGSNGEDSPRDMTIDANGDVYVTGTAIDFINKYSTIKLHGTDGQLLWQAIDSAGSRNGANAIALDELGGVYVTGFTDPDGDVSNQNENMYTVKRDAGTGTFVWSHLYGLNCVGRYDVPSDVIADSNHVFVAGRTSSAPYTADAITFVLDPQTGVETQRGVVANPSPISTGSGSLLFDAAHDLFNAGQLNDSTTGAVQISVFKYTSLDAAGAAFCAGDGSGTACPCGNDAAVGSASGCVSSLGVGGRLFASGNARFGADTLVLHGDQMPNSAVLFFQGTGQQAGGAGNVFGDGLRCASGQVARLGTKFNVGGASLYPAAGDAPISVRGGVTAAGVRTYQCWYRNAAAFCTPSPFNVTNGWQVTWAP